MAKKKSTQTKENKELTSNIEATQGLKGNVLIKVTQGKNILKTINVHNQATYNLLYGMLLSLHGENENSCRPNYIGVGKSNANPTTSYTLDGLLDEITKIRGITRANFKGEPTRNNQQQAQTVVYQCILPYENIGNSSDIYEIGLFGTATGNSLVARVVLTDPITLTQGQSLIAEWTFSLQNIA